MGIQHLAEGEKGEALAKKYLEQKGYKILATNYCVPGIGELDLVVMNKGTLVFVEVRTRTSLAMGHPFDTVDFVKRKKTVRAAEGFLLREKLYYDDIRFDLIAVIGEEIEHLEDAFYGKMLR